MSWIDPNFPTSATPSDLVGRVLGLNPGMMTGPGTNTYLVGRRSPILIDTGAGVDGYVPLFERYLAERGWRQPERVVLTHRHRDHLGGVAHLRERFPGLPVAKMLWKDTDLPEGITDLRDGDRIEADGATLIAVHTPGHASDHLCYYLPEERALFSGDLILSGSTTVIPEEDGDLGQYLDSLRRVQASRRRAHLFRARARHRQRRREDPGVHRPSPAARAPDPRRARQRRGDDPRHGRDHLRRGPDDAPQDGGAIGSLAL